MTGGAKSKVRLAVPYIKPNYASWLEKWDDRVECIDFTGRDPDELMRDASAYDALVLTGGGDVEPHRYGMPEMAVHCGGMDAVRDTLEWKLAGTAFLLKIPVFGICRGLQLLNVCMGGTLYADIARFHGSTFRHRGDTDEIHGVEWEKTSFLSRVQDETFGEVNSAHHQAVQVIAPGFVVAARSSDGIIEAIEYTGDADMLCQAVQWHPERMDPDNPLSLETGKLFLAKARLIRRR